MPKRTDLKSILIIGAGPIVIGQACEFDYSGTQACKALIHSVWGMHADVKSRSLDQYIVKVRDLFAAHGLELTAFRTVHGIGYIFDPSGVSAEGR